MKNTVTTTINLPVNSIHTIVDSNNKFVETNIEDLVTMMNTKGDESVDCVKTINTNVEICVDNRERTYKYIEPENLSITHEYAYINSIEKKNVGETNNIKYYALDIEFADGRKKTLVMPSYVKFYSKHKGTFIPVEYIRSRDILCDYSWRNVKTEDARELVDYENPAEYYNIKIAYSEDEPLNFYIDGILTNVSYNNFNKTTTSEE